MTAYRCTTASEDRAEPLTGTASTVRAFLAVESPGPWGVDAPRENRLPAAVTAELCRRAVRVGLRLLMIRRHGRSSPAGTTVLGAHADPGRPRLFTAVLDDPAELLDLDLAGIAAGEPAGLTPTGPVFLVCTHGRHDVCCAERGRPVAAALHAALPDRTFEVSHIGGDRFAGNVLVLPQGLYYGRLSPSRAVRTADGHLRGELDLEHLRGRSGYPFAVQAAEVYLLRHLGRAGLHDLRLLGRRTDGDDTVARFAYDGRRYDVRVRTASVAPEQLTCRAARHSVATRHRLLGITAAE